MANYLHFKQLISKLPKNWQLQLRRLRYRWLIVRDDFASEEPEYEKLPEWVGEGDWVIDVGANIGTYTLEMSRLVGSTGRVIALEPMPSTFEFLSRHVATLGGGNITLLNVAASNRAGPLKMTVPKLASGLDNLYQSRIAEMGEFNVLAMPLDALPIDHAVSLLKVDVEGHEMCVLRGARELIGRSRPVIVLEGQNARFEQFLRPFGYRGARFDSSPNTVFTPH